MCTYRPGNVIIWATFIRGGHRVRYELEVQQLPAPKASAIHLSRKEIRMAAGGQEKLYAAVLPAVLLEKQLVWESSDESVCRIVRQHINLSGLDEVILEGAGAGTAVVRGTCDGLEVSCSIHVSQEAVRIQELQLPKTVKIESEQVHRMAVRKMK